MKKNILFFLTLLLNLNLILNFSCSTLEPKLEPELKLELKDVSCTEAWLQLTTNNLQLPATINLLKNNSLSKVYILNTQDSLLYIDSLLPNQNYKFKIVANTTNNPQPTTNEVLAQTMDTTSHNFTWQTFTFGERTSILYDVAIINENDIWAVGEIYMNDSLGNPDPACYNAVHWDGQRWELKRIKTLFRGNIITVPLEGIFAFSSTDIWMVGSLPIRGDGTNWTMYDLRTTVDPNLSLSRVWGPNSNDMYFAGNNGNIAHYSNGSWTKIESGTDVSLNDIYGTPDGSIVWVSGYEDFKPTVLLKYNNGVLTKVIEDDLFGYKTDTITGWIKSIWLKRNKLFSLTFYDLYRSNTNTKGEGTAMWRGDINSWGSNVVRGNDVNDIFATGYNGLLWHYNGVSWKRYDELVNTTDPFYSMSVKGNIVVLAGERYLNGIERYGLIAIGKR